jgi:hypothetical protein
MAGVALETESLGSDLQKRQDGRTAVMPRIQLAVEGILRSISDASPIWDGSAVLSAITGSTKRGRRNCEVGVELAASETKNPIA